MRVFNVIFVVYVIKTFTSYFKLILRVLCHIFPIFVLIRRDLFCIFGVIFFLIQILISWFFKSDVPDFCHFVFSLPELCMLFFLWPFFLLLSGVMTFFLWRGVVLSSFFIFFQGVLNFHRLRLPQLETYTDTYDTYLYKNIFALNASFGCTLVLEPGLFGCSVSCKLMCGVYTIVCLKQ